MKHTLYFDGHPHEIWLSRTGDQFVLHSEFGERIIDVPSDAIVIADGDTVHIHFEGSAYSLRYQNPIERFAEELADDRDYAARAPMPGSVISVAVTEREEVRAGTTLLVIESMKLETAIKASRDGIVERIHFKVGQTFDRDAVLATLTRPEA